MSDISEITEVEVSLAGPGVITLEQLGQVPGAMGPPGIPGPPGPPGEDGVHGGGITESQRLLALLADGGPMEGYASGSFQEATYQAVLCTSRVWYESSSKLKRIVSREVTFNPNLTVHTIVWKSFSSTSGAVLATVTDTLAYSGIFETSRTRTIA